MILAVAALVLTVALPVPADEHVNIETEWLTYAGTNQGIPVLIQPDIYLPPPECDVPGTGGVKFCETLQNETLGHPDHAAINVRDDEGPRVGFVYRFVNETSGAILSSGSACGHVNDRVPHEGNGSNQNATELQVYPDLLTSAMLCGSPTIYTGTVVVTWRYIGTVE